MNNIHSKYLISNPTPRYTLLHQYLFAFFLLFANLLCINAHASSSLVCGIDYNDKKYEWIRGDADTDFQYINDSGQAVASRDNQDYPYIQFYDVGAYNGQRVTSAQQFSGEYKEYIRIVPFGIGEEGETFGYVHLINDFPANLPEEDKISFREFSTTFAYYWNTLSGFSDMNDIVPGITGRYDMGKETALVRKQAIIDGVSVNLGGSQLVTIDYTYSDGSTTPDYYTELNRPVRDKQHHIEMAMLDAINEQCGKSPVSSHATWLSNKYYDSNSNFEFVNGRNFVRIARPYITIPVDHYWSRVENGEPVFSYDDEGLISESLGMQFSLRNLGVVDVADITTEVEFVTGGGSNPIFSLSYLESTPSILNAGDRADNLIAYFTPKRAGTAGIRLRLEGIDENDNAVTFYSSTLNLTVTGTGTNLKLTLDEEPIKVGDTSALNITVSTSNPNDQTIQFSAPTLSIDKPGIIEITSPPVPAPFTINSKSSSYAISVPLTGLKSGVTILTSKILATDTVSKQAETIETKKTIVIDPLQVTVKVLPEQFIVNDTPKEKLGERCKLYNQEKKDAGTPDLQKSNCIEIEVQVKNISEQTVEKLTILDADRITDAIKSLDPKDIRVPLLQFDYQPPLDAQGQPLEVNLGQDETVTYVWLVDAIGGSPLLEVRPVARGTIGSTPVLSSDTAELKLIEDPLLKFGARLKRPATDKDHPDYNSQNAPFSGSPIRIEGFLENNSESSWIGVAVFAIPEENAGRGILFDVESDYRPTVDTTDRSCKKFAESEAGFLPDFTIGYLLPPKVKDEDPIRKNLEGVLATLCWDEFSEAKVHYVVEAYTLETDEDGNIVNDDSGNPVRLDRLTGQIEYETEDDYKDRFAIPLKANPYIPTAESGSDCQYVMVGFHLVCYAGAGVQSLLYGLAEIPPFMINILKTDAYYGVRLVHWSAEQWSNMYKAWFEEDPDAYAKLIAEAKLVSESLVLASVITADQQEALVVSAANELASVAEDYEKGNYKTLSGRTAYAVGANIDSFVSFGMVKSLAMKLQRARFIGGADEISKLTIAVEEGLQKASTKADINAVNQRVEAAAARGEPILDPAVLKANDPLSYNIIEKYGGVARDTTQIIEDIATKYKVSLAFRSRGAAAIEKIRNGLAYWKTQAIKLKNTGSTDVKHLGYPESALDTVIFVEPPVNVPTSIDKSVKNWANDIQFTKVLDDWMTAKGFQKPTGLQTLDEALHANRKAEIGDFSIDQRMDKYLEVRERARMRTEEWEKYTEADKFGTIDNPGAFVTDGLPMEFGYKANGLPGILDKIPLLKGERRPFRMQSGAWVNDADGVAKFVETTPDGRKIFSVEVDGPNGFRPFTGDIDFLHILDETGAIIKNPVRRFFVYWELAKKVGMQHGESFSFALNEATRARYLNDHLLDVVGAEALISILPNRIKRAAYYVRHRVVLEDLGNGVQHINIGEHFVPVTSAGHTLRTAQDVVKAILEPSTNWERFVAFFDKYPKWLMPLRIISGEVSGISDEDIAPEYSGNPDNEDARIIQPINGELNHLTRKAEGASIQAMMQPMATSYQLVWTPISIAEAKDSNGIINSLPYTALSAPVHPGDFSLEYISLEELGMPDTSPFLAPGQFIMINPTGSNQELVEIISINPLVLKNALAYEHEVAELIAVVPTRYLPRAEEIDSDNDGTPDINDAFPNDANEQYDFDGDDVGDNADTDDDNDGFSDADELKYNSDPYDALDTPQNHRPEAPVLTTVTVDSLAPLTRVYLDVSMFSDPDESGAATALEVELSGLLDNNSNGTIFIGQVLSTDPMTDPIELPRALLDHNAEYSIRTRYLDASGQYSDYSNTINFMTDATDPDDADSNGIEDTAEVSLPLDLNDNDIDDTDEFIVSFVDAVTNSGMGLASSMGSVTRLSNLDKYELRELPSADFPLGLIAFRINDLIAGQEVLTTLYLSEEQDNEAKWQEYNPNILANFGLADFSASTTINGKTVELSLVDGGLGDLDGVANGRIIVVGGLSIDIIPVAGGNGGGSGSSACFVATAVFGSSARETFTLRAFRDQYLLPTHIGKQFVEWYYQHSPAWVQWSENQPLLRQSVKFALQPVAELAALATGRKAEMPWPQLLLIMLLSAFVYRRRRRAKLS